jgi:hypothetical protein
MYAEIRKHRVQPYVPFTTVLESPLPFKIPVDSLRVANTYHSELEYGEAEYVSAVNNWISNCSLEVDVTSETAVAAMDYNWQLVLAKLCDLKVLFNQSDP